MTWLVKDPGGIACVVLAWLLMAFSQYGILTIVLLPQPDSIRKYIHIIVFEILSILAMIFHMKTILTDPGSIPQKTLTPELLQEISASTSPDYVVYKCSECCSIKPAKAHHCSICKRCIRRMDHHCPWVNNCVGENNQKHFILFTLHITLLSFHALSLTLSHFFECLHADWSASSTTCPILRKSGKPSPENLIILVILTFEALLFFLFTLIMFCLQMKAIKKQSKG